MDDDGLIDPNVASQLYGDVPAGLQGMGPAYQENPWNWVPQDWGMGAPPGAEHVGPGMGGAPTLDEQAAQATAPQAPMIGPPGPDQPMPDQIPPPGPVPPGMAPATPYGSGFEPSPFGPPGPKVSDLVDVHTETSADKYRDDPLSDPNPTERNALMADLAQRDPDKFNQIQILHDQARIHEEATQRAAIERKNAEDAQRSLDNYKQASATAQAKSDVIAADASRLADRKIDPNRFYNQGGIASHIGVGLNLIIGGLNASANGGRNTGAEWLTGMIDRDVDAQKADIANGWKGIDTRNNLVAQEFARTGDIYHATEVARLAGYQGAINELTSKMQDYDPAGTTALRMGQARQQLVQSHAAAVEQIRKTTFDEGLKLLDAQQKGDVNTETRRHNRAQEGIEYTRLGIEKSKVRALTPEQEKYQRELAGRVIGGIPTLGKDGKLAYDVIRNNDGTAFIANTEDQAKAIQKAAPAVHDVVRLVNSINKDIADLGVLDKSSTLATAKHQKLSADREALVFALHGAEGIEGFRPGVAEMLKDLTGGVEPDKWGRDATAGFKRASENIVSQFNSQLHVAGYQGEYKPADLSQLDDPVSTEDEKKIERMTIGSADKDSGKAIATAQDYVDITQYGAKFAAGDKGAGEVLTTLANGSKNIRIKELARDALNRAADVGGSVPAVEDPTTVYGDPFGDKSAAHETVPPLPKKAEPPKKLYPNPRGTQR